LQCVDFETHTDLLFSFTLDFKPETQFQ